MEPWKDRMKRSTSTSRTRETTPAAVGAPGAGGVRAPAGKGNERTQRGRAATVPSNRRTTNGYHERKEDEEVKEKLHPQVIRYQLEDKPLSSSTSVPHSRPPPPTTTANPNSNPTNLTRGPSLKLALERVGFTLAPLKVRSANEEKRVLVFMADGCEEIEVV